MDYYKSLDHSHSVSYHEFSFFSMRGLRSTFLRVGEKPEATRHPDPSETAVAVKDGTW